MLKLNLAFLFLSSTCFTSLLVQSRCNTGCDLALGSYYVQLGAGFDTVNISGYINTNASNIVKYNPNTVPNQDSLQALVRIRLPFSCDCINGEFLGHVFNYDIRSEDTYAKIAQVWYANLTTGDWIQRFNSYGSDTLPDTGNVNVTVNCSCGNSLISKDYGLFLTYPLRPEDTLDTISLKANLSSDLIRRYNPNADFNQGHQGSGLIYIPAKGLSDLAIGGITVGVVAVVLFLAGCLYARVYRNKNTDRSSVLLQNAQVQLMAAQGITIDKSVEFSYEELSTATYEFSLANKIGQGGFGAVYYAELRGEKAAIKKMDMQASRQFLAELKVLTHTHHVNLVRLIGYCVVRSLFLVYEYIENGNLSQHLHGSGQFQKGTHYHGLLESKLPLIQQGVADFGLTRLTVVGSRSRLAGTFGYMPPEYVQYGDVSPKVDVYAFGVVLYELMSAKKAIIREKDPVSEPKSLVSLFDEVLNQADPKDGLVRMNMIDPRLGDNYNLDSMHKMAQLAKVCTLEDPRLRPSMRHVVVALMTISSSTKDGDAGSFYENQTALSLMPGE
ncbi:hypothetical protein SSX86_006660 [Deinandra increscens subsp. villosa]|uniref:non-specific serine/threonine protein kinase n=1 Tax=Deinandra increscens subsp. villosa TaxID=3103831 RepID=A0AAP0DN59_9ASTR